MKTSSSRLCGSPLSTPEQDDQSKELLFEEISQYFHLPLEEVCVLFFLIPLLIFYLNFVTTFPPVSISLTFDPIFQAAKTLGMCSTKLKDICRRNGIPRWPYRKLTALENKMTKLKELLKHKPHSEHSLIQQEIQELKKQKRMIFENSKSFTIFNIKEDTQTSATPPAVGHTNFKYRPMVTRYGSNRSTMSSDSCSITPNSGLEEESQRIASVLSFDNLLNSSFEIEKQQITVEKQGSEKSEGGVTSESRYEVDKCPTHEHHDEPDKSRSNPTTNKTEHNLAHRSLPLLNLTLMNSSWYSHGSDDSYSDSKSLRSLHLTPSAHPTPSSGQTIASSLSEIMSSASFSSPHSSTSASMSRSPFQSLHFQSQGSAFQTSSSHSGPSSPRLSRQSASTHTPQLAHYPTQPFSNFTSSVLFSNTSIPHHSISPFFESTCATTPNSVQSPGIFSSRGMVYQRPNVDLYSPETAMLLSPNSYSSRSGPDATVERHMNVDSLKRSQSHSREDTPSPLIAKRTRTTPRIDMDWCG
jgi:hypothetical protein